VSEAGRKPRIAPSLLSADFTDLRGQIRTVEEGGADLLHLDVMDGHFVPNLTFGPFIVAAIRRLTKLPLDCHLMVSDPAKYAPEFAKAGGDSVTIHIEAAPDPAPILADLRARGARAGLSLNPETPFEAVEPFLEEIDILLVMSVRPGFAGQTFLADVLPKVTRARELRSRGRGTFEIEIDGGIDRSTGPRACGAGAEILVAGSAIFRAPSPREEVGILRSAARAGIAG
jgi:ribulose-phosphate 3-epimerase